MKTAIYNTIGKNYDVTRKADPALVTEMIKLLDPKLNGYYLDIGCGSGNYAGALAGRGLNITGIDYSEEMLRKARNKFPQIDFYQGSALDMPFKEDSFDGATCVMATHHIGDNMGTFAETYRVMQAGSFVIFTSTPEQMKTYWLHHYFPKMMEDTTKKMCSYEEIKHDLERAGFKRVTPHSYFVTNELQDLFLHSGKYRPEIYLNPAVRDGISTFHLSLSQEELHEGLAKLEADIKSNAIEQIISKYESTLGDYTFIVGEK